MIDVYKIKNTCSEFLRKQIIITLIRFIELMRILYFKEENNFLDRTSRITDKMFGIVSGKKCK